MPRRRERVGPPRVPRDREKIADLFVQIDKTVVKCAKDEAKRRNVHLWEIVEEALTRFLPTELSTPTQPSLLDIDIPQRNRMGPARVARDNDSIADLFVQIDKAVGKRAKDEAGLRNVHLWEIVEEALTGSLPTGLSAPTQSSLLDIPQQDRMAS